MRESDLQALYNSYHQAAQDIQAKEKALSELHYCVYQYAAKRFGANHDTTSAFYMKMYHRIEDILNKYDPKYKISFFIYFSVILKKNYLKFFSQITKREEMYHDFYDWETEIQGSYEATIDSLGEEENQKNDETKDQSGLKNLIIQAISFLDINQDISLRLNFGFYLLLKHLRELMVRHQGLYFFPFYREYIQKVREWEMKTSQDKTQILEKTQVLYQKLQTQHLNEKRTEQRNRLIDEFYKIKSPASLKMIARLIKRSISQVHSYIQLGKIELKKIFFEKYTEIINALSITK